ncbi:hypothetical protein EZJ19_06335 [Parasulfuritortus cantonensis]|uniref:Uncharacterized protein n=1 Tax=Parasulfuritortus cantonensis TaxID=2528202 RepID=A0A4R1BF54_9PROT|nr:hypothetical protein [Parasulfuritortus cantonensis]TCJ15743.1 hypothetical protein EZJ19_06335 [Parasulfuritortus cantonensis]
MGRLARRQSTSVKTKAVVTREGGVKLAQSFLITPTKPEDVKVTGEASWKKKSWPAPISGQGNAGHAPGFLPRQQAGIAFEEVYVDIIKRAFLPKLMGRPTKIGSAC